MTEYRNRSALRALGVLEVVLTASRGLLLTDIATAATLDRATTFRLLQVLMGKGYIIRDEQTKRYSMKLNAVYFRSKAELPAIASRLARSALCQLHSETGAEVSVASFQGAGVYYRREYLGHHQIGETLLRCILPSHATACGKVLLAYRPQYEVRKIFEFLPLTAYTPRTIQSLHRLEAELQKVRERGYAETERELLDDRTCIAVPIQTRNTDCMLALSISLPVTKINGYSTGQLTDAIRRTKDRINRVLEGRSRIPASVAAAFASDDGVALQ